MFDEVRVRRHSFARRLRGCQGWASVASDARPDSRAPLRVDNQPFNEARRRCPTFTSSFPSVAPFNTRATEYYGSTRLACSLFRREESAERLVRAALPNNWLVAWRAFNSRSSFLPFYTLFDFKTRTPPTCHTCVRSAFAEPVKRSTARMPRQRLIIYAICDESETSELRFRVGKCESTRVKHLRKSAER